MGQAGHNAPGSYFRTTYWGFGESLIGNIVPKDGKIKNLSVRIRGNTSFFPLKFVVIKNNNETALSVSTTLGQTGIFQNNVDEVSVAAGDRIRLDIKTIPELETTFSFSRVDVAVTYEADEGNASFHNTEMMITTSAPNYQSLAGGPYGGFATEAHAQTKIGAPCTLKNLRVINIKKFPSAAVTVRLRINGNYGNLSATITQNTQGEYSDLIHTDELNEGDLVDWEISRSGVGVIVISVERETVGHSKNELYVMGPNLTYNIGGAGTYKRMWAIGFAEDMPFLHGGVRILSEGGIEGNNTVKFVFEKLRAHIIQAYTDPGQALMLFSILKCLNSDYDRWAEVTLPKNSSGWQDFDVNFSVPDGIGATEEWKTTTQIAAMIRTYGNPIFMLDYLIWNGFTLTYEAKRTAKIKIEKSGAYEMTVDIIKTTKAAVYRMIVATGMPLAAGYRMVTGRTVRHLLSKFVLKIFPYKKKASPYSAKESPYHKLKK